MDNTTNINQEILKRKMKKSIKILIWSVGVLVLLIIAFTQSTYIVGESEQAVVSRFGVIHTVVLAPGNDFLERNPDLMNTSEATLENVNIVHGKGLYFKIPFIDKVDTYRSYLYTYVSGSEPVNTSEKKQYYLTMYAQWRITNPALFYISHRDMVKAEVYLDNLIYPAIIQNINKLNADQFITDKASLEEALRKGLNSVNETVRTSGIEVMDVQVHRTLLPPANLQSTYDRMIANRAKGAQQLRSEGVESYNKAVSDADREARVLRAEAVTESERIKGEGDAAALEIYADSYSIDREFYTFWRSLQALEKSIDENTVLILDENHPLWSDLLKWTQSDPVAAATPTPAPPAEPDGGE